MSQTGKDFPAQTVVAIIAIMRQPVHAVKITCAKVGQYITIQAKLAVSILHVGTDVGYSSMFFPLWFCNLELYVSANYIKQSVVLNTVCISTVDVLCGGLIIVAVAGQVPQHKAAIHSQWGIMRFSSGCYYHRANRDDTPIQLCMPENGRMHQCLYLKPTTIPWSDFDQTWHRVTTWPQNNLVYKNFL